MSVIATLSLEQAGQREWDALVVGAGPAGSLAARELARRGRSVLLVDRAAFPRAKVCGCCLNRRSLATLQAVGLGELTRQCQAVPLRFVRLAAQGRQALLPLPDGASLSRQKFDTALVEAAIEAGVEWLPCTRATLGPLMDQARIVALHQGERVKQASGRIVLAADGLNGNLVTNEPGLQTYPEKNSRIGAGVIVDQAPSFYEPGIISMACGRGGYGGLVRLEDGRLDIAAALDPAFVRQLGGPGKAVEAILAEANFPAVRGLREAVWRGTPALTQSASRLAAKRVFVLGDAAGYIEPFTGEGIAWALASAVILAPLADRASRSWDSSLGDQWTALYQRHLGRRQRLCRVMAGILRWPRLVRILVGMLSRMPMLAGPVISRLNRSP